MGVFDRQANFRIFSDMVNGLVEIHKNDMIHRDLKPENIFIDDSKKNCLPTAKIGDFGLARMLKNQTEVDKKGLLTEMEEARNSFVSTMMSSEQVTQQQNNSFSVASRFSSVAGTKAYMAPEIEKHFGQGTKPEKF